jgi:hypothetical protein
MTPGGSQEAQNRIARSGVRPVIQTILSIVLGLTLAIAGARFMYTSQFNYGDLSFFRAWTPRSLAFYGGAVMLCLGLWFLISGVRIRR